VYYISPEIWLRDLYQRADIAEVLDNSLDPATFPQGSLRRSAGWRQKVTDNPLMNADRRHAPLVGMADGAPYYKDKGCGTGWFFILRHAGLPEALLLDQTLAHLTLFISSEHFEIDEEGNTIRRRKYRAHAAYARLCYVCTICHFSINPNTSCESARNVHTF
jgi:hypothetical protein